MFNKNDPLIGAVQEVMKRNQAEREAARLVNEKFGVQDRKALPHEHQSAWDAAYQQVLTEGVEALGEEQIDEVLDSSEKRMKYGLKALGSYVKASLTGDKNTKRKRLAGNKNYKKKVADAAKKSEEDKFNNSMARKALIDMGNKSGSGFNYEKMFKEEALDEKVKMTKQQFANLDGDPKFTANDLAHARKGTHVKKDAAGNLEEDETSPSSMGIKKPDYASGTPDYANKGPQMVNRAAKTSAPAGTVKEENLEEESVSKRQRRFFGLVRGIQKREAHGSANAKKAAKSMSAKSVRDYAKTSEKGLPEKVSENVSGSQIRGQSQYGRNPSPTARPTPAATNPNNSTGVYAAQQGAADRAKLDAMAASRRTAVASQPPRSPMAGQGTSALPKSPMAGQGAPRPLPKSPMAGQGTSALPKSPMAGQGTSKSVVPKPNLKPATQGAPAAAVKKAAPAATQTARPAGGTKRPVTPVRKASTSGGLRTQKDANLLARAKAGGGQRLSTTFKSGGDRLNYLRARAQANK